MLNTEGYEYLALGEVCSKITDGSHNPPKGCDSSDYIMISSKNISPDCLDLSDVRYLTKDEFESENKRTNVSANDILLTIVGTIGRTYLVKGNEGNIVMQRSVAVLTPKKNIDPTFLMYSLLIDSELEKEGRGNAQKGVYLKQLAKYKVKIPSFKCQNKFCEIYNQADKSKFVGFKSQFIEMFGGDFPCELWENCLTITNGKKYPEEYSDTGVYPVCGSGGTMGYGNHKLCSKETTILGRKGNINSPIYMDTDYWIVDTAFSLDVDREKLHPKYFFYWCTLFDFTKYNKQGVLPSLTKNDLLKIEMPIPPKDKQIKFVAIVEQADKSKYVS